MVATISVSIPDRARYTADGLIYLPHQDVRGEYLKRTKEVISLPNPLTQAELSSYKVFQGEKIDKDCWDQLVTFFMEFNASQLEVQARIYSRAMAKIFEETPSEEFPHTYIVVIPRQQISAAAVKYDYTLGCYDLDGKQWSLDELDYAGYVLFGHFHLHPFDMPNPSGIDDANELSDPQLYGIVSIPSKRSSSLQYRIRTTIVANNGVKNVRYSVKASDFINIPDVDIQEYEPTHFDAVASTMISRGFDPSLAKVSTFDYQRYPVESEFDKDWIYKDFTRTKTWTSNPDKKGKPQKTGKESLKGYIRHYGVPAFFKQLFEILEPKVLLKEVLKQALYFYSSHEILNFEISEFLKELKDKKDG